MTALPVIRPPGPGIRGTTLGYMGIKSDEVVSGLVDLTFRAAMRRVGLVPISPVSVG